MIEESARLLCARCGSPGHAERDCRAGEDDAEVDIEALYAETGGEA